MPNDKSAADQELEDQKERELLLEEVRTALREAFEGGDKLALLDCIRICDSYHLPLPRWALEVLSSAALKYFDGTSDDFHKALLGVSEKKGRHFRFSTERVDQLRHNLTFDVVWALRRSGLKGDAVYYEASRLIGERYYIGPDGQLAFGSSSKNQILEPGTVRKRFLDKQKKKATPSIYARLILGDILEQKEKNQEK